MSPKHFKALSCCIKIKMHHRHVSKLLSPPNQLSPNAPEFAQPCLSRSNGGHPQRGGTNLGVFVPIWLVLHRCEATSLGVFDLCRFALLKQSCANSGGFGAR